MTCLSIAFLLVALGADVADAHTAEPTVSDLRTALSALDESSGIEEYGGYDARPFQIFMRLDPSDVPDDLLLAVLLAGSVQGDVVQVSKELLREAHGDLALVDRIARNLEGVGLAAVARLRAAEELGTRTATRSMDLQHRITSPDDAAKLLEPLLRGKDERLAALYLDSGHRPIAVRRLTVGTPGYTIVDPMQVMRTAVELDARSVILGHQHPSGDPTPSPQDIDVTERVQAAGRVLGVPLLDHLIIGKRGSHVSLAERGELPSWSRGAVDWISEP